MSENEKEKVKVEDLPVPLEDLNAEEQEDVKGGVGSFNPTRPSNLNPALNPKPKPDAY
ncbi:MAG TPA: hypothetical protein VIV66_05400 [Pyrinomonadaceae bacterium]